MRTDEALVMAVRDGDTGAFDELYVRYSARLFGYVRRFCDDEAEAEDLFQEIFLEVLRDRSLELREGRFGAWLFTVARNRCLDARRGSSRRERRLGVLEREPAPVAAASPEELAMRGQTLHAVRAALGQLSAVHQDALLLKEVGGLTYRQIAELQVVPEGTAKSRLHVAVSALRRLLRGGSMKEE